MKTGRIAVKSKIGDPKKSTRKRRKKHSASIIQHGEDLNRCYLCMTLRNDYAFKSGLETHHIFFGSGQRDKSEADGLTVRLCRYHHKANGGPEAVHRNNDVRRLLCRTGQQAYEEEYGHEAYMERYGRNYLQEGEA